MCRHLAYVGPATAMEDWLLDSTNSLLHQAWAPQQQRHGVVNADGSGLGWYRAAGEPPLLHRGAQPIWQDETFAELARSQSAVGLLAAVRSATLTTYGTGAAMPFRHGRWLFSHNGALSGWPDAAAPLAARLAVTQLLRLEAMTDAALLWALVLDGLQAGVAAAQAVGDVVRSGLDTCGGRFNLLLTDGEQIVATACGASLSVRSPIRHGEGVLVASEPVDDHPGWRAVPDGSLVRARSDHVQVTPL